MKVIESAQVTAAAGSSGGMPITFDTKIKDKLPMLKKVICNDTIAADKLFLTLKSKKIEVTLINDIDVNNFNQVNKKYVDDLNAPDGQYNYSIRNIDTSDHTVTLIFILEYDI